MAQSNNMDIASLQALIDNTEQNDAEAHKLYNNLGLAYFAERDFRESLRAHREEKAICKRLLNQTPNDSQRHIDLAIAYRRCGDCMIKLDRVVSHDKVINQRKSIIKLAQQQHRHGLEIINKHNYQSSKSRSTNPKKHSIRLEIQAASAALGQSSLALALQTKEKKHFIRAAKESGKAARTANKLLTVGYGGVSYSSKRSILLGICLNHAIALSELGEKKRAKILLQTVAIRAKSLNDRENLVRAVSNLSEEEGNDNDWELCISYAKEWVNLAREEHDENDENDALRKLGVAYRESGDLKKAEDCLVQSLNLQTNEKNSINEAKSFLKTIQQEIKEYQKSAYEYSLTIRKADIAKCEHDYNEEAILRLKAGNCAFIIRNTENVVLNLQRYFQLVDTYGCQPVMTGVDEGSHNNAIANMGECMWKLKRYEQAVHWASRELSIYDGDLPGQAQAYCNLGVYLDDFGKKDKAIDALLKSIEIAKKCREVDTMKRAQGNLHLIRQELKESKKKEGIDFDDDDDRGNGNGNGNGNEAVFQVRNRSSSRSKGHLLRTDDDEDEDEDDCEIVDIATDAKSKSNGAANEIPVTTTTTTRNGNNNTNLVTPTRSSGSGSGDRSNRFSNSSGSKKRKQIDGNDGNNDNMNSIAASGCITADSNGGCINDDEGGEKSIIMVSTQTMKKTKTTNNNNNDNDNDNNDNNKSTCASTTKQSMIRRRSDNKSVGTIVDRSGTDEYSTISNRTREQSDGTTTRTLKNIIDLPREYRSICLKKSSSSQSSSRKQNNKDNSNHSQYGPRPMIINAFRELASKLVSRDATDDIHSPIIRLNLSNLLIETDDVGTIFETLSTISEQYGIFLDISLNPIINSSAYDILTIQSSSTSSRRILLSNSNAQLQQLSSPKFKLHAIKQLDLSCAGVTPETIRKLSDAMSAEYNGSLTQVLDLNLSKNSLGRHGSLTSISISRLISQSYRLRCLDLSINMLSNDFLIEFLDKLSSLKLEECSLQTLNLCLNNRRAPTALLETHSLQLVVDSFKKLFKCIETLEAVNVRACGASLNMRNALRQFSDTMADSSRSIVTVSDENLDEDV